MVMTGVIRSRLPITTQLEQMNMVASVAKWGSTPSGALKYFRTGRMSSLAMAAKSLGAPVKLCRAAPSVDKITPTCTTHATGHATVAVNNLFTSYNLHVILGQHRLALHAYCTVPETKALYMNFSNKLEALENLLLQDIVH